MKRALPRGDQRHRTGAHAEAWAQRFLEAHGLVLVERNFRCRDGELDLVMLDGRELVIVEVRCRTSDALVRPEITVSATKRRRLLRAAARYLQLHPAFADHAVRFDVLGLTGQPDRPHCEWIRCAFTTDDVGCC
ncbi:MAG: YraN family protein [Gammaproteobacteria bacterium]|nr:MAG: YraN family protein [Gammaproteobacteria bacterium]